jgi:hypothetical protein
MSVALSAWGRHAYSRIVEGPPYFLLLHPEPVEQVQMWYCLAPLTFHFCILKLWMRCRSGAANRKHESVQSVARQWFEEANADVRMYVVAQ